MHTDPSIHVCFASDMLGKWLKVLLGKMQDTQTRKLKGTISKKLLIV
jgi:hypothetical protein